FEDELRAWVERNRPAYSRPRADFTQVPEEDLSRAVDDYSDWEIRCARLEAELESWREKAEADLKSDEALRIYEALCILCEVFDAPGAAAGPAMRAGELLQKRRASHDAVNYFRRAVEGYEKREGDQDLLLLASHHLVDCLYEDARLDEALKA